MFGLDDRTDVPMFRRIYEQVRAAITTGQLRPGERMPSARSLATQLGVARGTVDAAYCMLAGEAWVIPRGASGTYVASRVEAPRTRAAQRLAAPFVSSRSDEPEPLPFRMGLPALDAFPRKLWARLVGGVVRSMSTSSMGYPHPRGIGPLREAIAGYLGVARGVACAADQIFITAGYQGALGLIMRALSRPGDQIWHENPGYPRSRLALKEMGAHAVPVAVDADGMQVDDGLVRAPLARFAIVTPAHHCTLGVTLSPERRHSLLAWAGKNGAWVIEDDYNGEFTYNGPLQPALKSLDRNDNVLYTGTFSKVLFPALRLGYLVVPCHLVSTFHRVCETFHAGSGRLEQEVVARFIQEGHFARHLKRMRELYTNRRLAVIEALTESFGSLLKCESTPGGMHVLARLTRVEISDVELVRLAQARKLAPDALSRHSFGPAIDRGEQGLLLGFANIPEKQAKDLVQELFEAIAGSLIPQHRV